MPAEAFPFEPAILLKGTSKEADRFIVAALWENTGAPVPVAYVANWARILQLRGDEFASHASACHYWLFEHRPDQASDQDSVELLSQALRSWGWHFLFRMVIKRSGCECLP